MSENITLGEYIKSLGIDDDDILVEEFVSGKDRVVIIIRKSTGEELFKAKTWFLRVRL